jgi:hypothetical protein
MISPYKKPKHSLGGLVMLLITNREPKGHSYFLNDQNDNIGAVFEHMYNTIKNGRVQVDDSVNRKHIL